jgi:DNA-binding PadR family transcriptional regulator
MIDGTILGIISWYPCSGYDMRAELEHGGAGMLSALSFGSIYPRLKALERDRLIETRDESTGARPRKVHELTAAGWEALADWLAEPAEYPIPTRDELLLRMLFWGTGRPEDRGTLIEHLRARRARSRELLELTDAWPRNGQSFIDEYAVLTFDYFRARLEAELAWIDRAIAHLEGPPQPPTQDPCGLAEQQQERRQSALRGAQQAARDEPSVGEAHPRE